MMNAIQISYQYTKYMLIKTTFIVSLFRKKVVLYEVKHVHWYTHNNDTGVTQNVH